jgi:hypothetical protein
MKNEIVIGALIICLLMVFGIEAVYGEQTGQVSNVERRDIKTNLKFAGTQIDLENVSLEQGREIHFSAVVKAELLPAMNVKIAVGIDNNVLHQFTYAKIYPNHNVVVSFNWNASAGRHTVFYKIDPENKIPESCETDNYLSRSINVNPISVTPIVQIPQPEKKPIVECPENGTDDLEAVSLSFNQINPSNVHYEVKWKNNGMKCVHSVNWHLIDIVNGREIYVYKAYVPNGKGYALPGEVVVQTGVIYKKDLHVGTCSIDNGFLPDTYYACSKLKLVLDYDHLVNETNESNNETEGTIKYFW